MIEPTFPDNEQQRQLAVDRYAILDTMPEACFDDITSMMSQISGTPISLITMLDHDRNYLKSHHGVPFSESPRSISFCGHAINSDEDIMIVEDARLDERFADNPLVTEHSVAFYAGAPLITPDGYRLGTLCLFDVQPRTLTEETKAILEKMARQVERLLDLRIKNSQLIKTKNQLEEHNEELSKFARTISHDIKSPLTSLLYLTDALIEDSEESDDNAFLEPLKRIKNSASSLANYADELLDYYLSNDRNRNRIEKVEVDSIFREIQLMCGSAAETTITFSSECSFINANKASLCQILINLVSNSIKYTDKSKTEIVVSCTESDECVTFSVSDNGTGIPLDKLDVIFKKFATTNNVSKDGNAGTGVGLHTVKRIIDGMGGEISVTSKIKHGSTFTFTVPKTVSSDIDLSEAV